MCVSNTEPLTSSYRASRTVSCNQNIFGSRLEVTNRLISLFLRLATVNGHSRDALQQKVLMNIVDVLCQVARMAKEVSGRDRALLRTFLFSAKMRTGGAVFWRQVRR